MVDVNSTGKPHHNTGTPTSLNFPGARLELPILAWSTDRFNCGAWTLRTGARIAVGSTCVRKEGRPEYFDHIISFDMTGAKKPAPVAFLLALKLLQTLPSETLHMGDIIRRDIAPAQALGMITAYAAYGDRIIRTGNPPSCRPDFILNDIGELVGLVGNETK
jgi:phosphoglycolate phosphatase-like HAD superfamily hydrolase